MRQPFDKNMPTFGDALAAMGTVTIIIITSMFFVIATGAAGLFDAPDAQEIGIQP